MADRVDDQIYCPLRTSKFACRKSWGSVMKRTNGILMLLFAVVLVSRLVDAHAFQEHQLFDYTNLESESIQRIQNIEETLSQTRSEPTTLEIYLIRFNIDLLDSLITSVDNNSGEESISLELKEAPVFFFTPSGTRAEFDQIYIDLKRHTPSDFFIAGSHTEGLLADVFVDFALSFFDGAALGNIHVGNEVFFVSSMGENLHVLILLDTSKFRNEGPIPNSE